jgi:hypothetical protein
MKISSAVLSCISGLLWAQKSPAFFQPVSISGRLTHSSVFLRHAPVEIRLPSTHSSSENDSVDEPLNWQRSMGEFVKSQFGTLDPREFCDAAKSFFDGVFGSEKSIENTVDSKILIKELIYFLDGPNQQSVVLTPRMLEDISRPALPDQKLVFIYQHSGMHLVLAPEECQSVRETLAKMGVNDASYHHRYPVLYFTEGASSEMALKQITPLYREYCNLHRDAMNPHHLKQYNDFIRALLPQFYKLTRPSESETGLVFKRDGFLVLWPPAESEPHS